MKNYKNQKAQAVVELAIFGSLILLLFGVLLSFMQRENDQQYVQMETFRRALEKACTYQGETSEGAGASVQMSLMENRRHVDLASGFRKGAPSSSGYSANIFWAIPKIGEQAENLIVYKINDDEKTWNYRDFIPEANDDTQSFRIEDTSVDTATNFDETITKEEDAAKIINTRKSTLSDTMTTNINYSVRAKDSDNNPDNDPIVDGPKTLWSITQGLYKDSNGEYKYSEAASGIEVQHEKIWTTGF